MATTNEGRPRGQQGEGQVEVRRSQGEVQRSQERRVRPAVDIYENNEELLLHADLPGVQPDSLDVSLENGLLSIEGRRTVFAGTNQPPTQWIYARSFQLPGGTDADKIQANLRQGVLELHLPKRDQVKPRQIKILAG